MSIANYAEGAILDALFNNMLLQKAARYVQLHTADPTDTGTVAVAANNTRQALTGAASVGGVFTSVNDLTWTNVPASETYTHVSIWDAVTAGNCIWTGALTASKAVTAGDTFTIPTGSLTVTID